MSNTTSTTKKSTKTPTKAVKKANSASKRKSSRTDRTPEEIARDKKKANKTSFKPGNTANNKYNSKYCQDIVSYFNREPMQVLYTKCYDNKGNLVKEIPVQMPAIYPTFELFAASIGVITETLLNWCELYPEFAAAHAQAKQLQKGLLVTNAVRGLYNPLYAKFEAVNNFALKDKSEVTNTITAMSDEDKALIEKVSKRVGGGNGEK